MNDVIEKLLAVQELDTRILAIRKKLEEGPRRLSTEERELEEHRERLRQSSRKAKEATLAAERKNRELEALDQKMKDLGLKQYAARSNKEYEAIKHEIAGLKADFELLEDEALAHWSVGEEREREARVEQDRVQALEADLARKRAEWEEEARVFREELAALEKEREVHSRDVPLKWMTVYERVVESRGTPAVVPVVDQYCQGCQMSVTIHDVTRAWKGAEIVQCRSCSRILYADTV